MIIPFIFEPNCSTGSIPPLSKDYNLIIITLPINHTGWIEQVSHNGCGTNTIEHAVLL